MHFLNCSVDHRASNNMTENCTLLDYFPGHNAAFLPSLATKVGKITAYFLIAFLALVGNIFVIAVICRNKPLRKAINFFILNMAISDLFIPTISIPLRLYALFVDSPISVWPFGGVTGEVLCKLSMFLADSSPVVSILSLVFMTVDRFNAVAFPFKARLVSSKVRMVLLACSWIVAFAFVSPYFYALKIKKIHDQNYCVLDWEPAFNQNTTMDIYSTIACVLFTIIPFIILSVMYTIVLLILRKQTIALSRSQKASSRRQKNNRNIVLMALAIVLVFAVCWGPYNGFIFMLTIVWRWKIPQGVHATLDFGSFLFVTQFLTCSNAAINPCIYFIFIQSYRAALKNLVCGKSRRNGKDSISYLQTKRRKNDSASLTIEAGQYDTTTVTEKFL